MTGIAQESRIKVDPGHLLTDFFHFFDEAHCNTCVYWFKLLYKLKISPFSIFIAGEPVQYLQGC
jgi:hypothetical protein